MKQLAISSLLAITALLSACDNAPTPEDFLADPALRAETTKKCRYASSSVRAGKECKNLGEAIGRCFNGDDKCVREQRPSSSNWAPTKTAPLKQLPKLH